MIVPYRRNREAISIGAADNLPKEKMMQQVAVWICVVVLLLVIGAIAQLPTWVLVIIGAAVCLWFLKLDQEGPRKKDEKRRKKGRQ